MRHRYVHGGFADTETRFSIYLPPPDLYEGRFFQHITPVPDNECLAGALQVSRTRSSFPSRAAAASCVDPAAWVSLERRHSFADPGICFPAVRVVSQREGGTGSPYARLQNLARVRVVVGALGPADGSGG